MMVSVMEGFCPPAAWTRTQLDLLRFKGHSSGLQATSPLLISSPS